MGSLSKIINEELDNDLMGDDGVSNKRNFR